MRARGLDLCVVRGTSLEPSCRSPDAASTDFYESSQLRRLSVRHSRSEFWDIRRNRLCAVLLVLLAIGNRRI